jgi:hypothetical protein
MLPRSKKGCRAIEREREEYEIKQVLAKERQKPNDTRCKLMEGDVNAAECSAMIRSNPIIANLLLINTWLKPRFVKSHARSLHA